MWTNLELKNRAKFVLSRTYWKIVLAFLIVVGISAAASSVISLFTTSSAIIHVISAPRDFAAGISPDHYFDGLSIFIMAITYSFSFALGIFFSMPVTVGMAKFLLNGRQQQPDYGVLFFAFKKGRYLKIVGAMLWNMLFNMLWSIPYWAATGGFWLATHLWMNELVMVGLIIFCSILSIASVVLMVYKSISYSLTAYILSDNPSIGFRRALRLSIEMTKGQVGRIFLLGLSFIGWCLLGVLVCGIGLLFVMPYLAATFAELYATLRDGALRARICSFSELNFAEPGPEFYNR